MFKLTKLTGVWASATNDLYNAYSEALIVRLPDTNCCEKRIIQFTITMMSILFYIYMMQLHRKTSYPSFRWEWGSSDSRSLVHSRSSVLSPPSITDSLLLLTQHQRPPTRLRGPADGTCWRWWFDVVSLTLRERSLRETWRLCFNPPSVSYRTKQHVEHYQNYEVLCLSGLVSPTARFK